MCTVEASAFEASRTQVEAVISSRLQAMGLQMRPDKAARFYVAAFLLSVMLHEIARDARSSSRSGQDATFLFAGLEAEA